MSTRKGEATRKRPQKHQNTRAFKNNLYDKTALTKAINGLQISNVCERCKNILDWKIKYKKFKVMKAPGKCNKCSERCVKHAYHVMCKPCADKEGVCPKCGKREELVEPTPSREERLKLDQEMQEMLKSLPERKRRTFLRYMEKKKKKVRKESEADSDDMLNDKSSKVKKGDQDNDDNNDDDDDAKKGTQDLMAFLQRLKLSCKNGDEFDDFNDLDDFGDSDSDSFADDGEDESEDDDDSDDGKE